METKDSKVCELQCPRPFRLTASLTFHSRRCCVRPVCQTMRGNHSALWGNHMLSLIMCFTVFTRESLTERGLLA